MINSQFLRKIKEIFIQNLEFYGDFSGFSLIVYVLKLFSDKV